MLGFLRSLHRVECRCTHCGGHWRIPVRRLHRVERFVGLPPGEPLLWECHDCHLGVVVPGPYANIHGDTHLLDLSTIPPDATVYAL